MQILQSAMTRAELKIIAEECFGDMVKAVVDLKKGIMAVGGELHADAEQMLLEQGSLQSDLWGINLYPEVLTDAWIEFDSMINLRPAQNNRTRGVDDLILQERIRSVVFSLIK